MDKLATGGPLEMNRLITSADIGFPYIPVIVPKGYKGVRRRIQEAVELIELSAYQCSEPENDNDVEFTIDELHENESEKAKWQEKRPCFSFYDRMAVKEICRSKTPLETFCKPSENKAIIPGRVTENTFVSKIPLETFHEVLIKDDIDYDHMIVEDICKIKNPVQIRDAFEKESFQNGVIESCINSPTEQNKKAAPKIVACSKLYGIINGSVMKSRPIMLNNGTNTNLKKSTKDRTQGTKISSNLFSCIDKWSDKTGQRLLTDD